MACSRTQIRPSFTTKKKAILASLSVPESSYSDLSPKGSVDEAIKSLLDRINALEGIVTTSSCSGRISVFLEGTKNGSALSIGAKTREEDEIPSKVKEQATVPGGKGMGGRWLFVSHEPVQLYENGNPVSNVLGMQCLPQVNAIHSEVDIAKVRLARFQFEPMILHAMCASLHHAQPILAAAINAGFRESGVQSLKNLDDANAFPMVAIRSSGLAFESIVGSQFEGDENNDEVYSVVAENYLQILIQIANERFKTNTERIKRFEEDLFRREAPPSAVWEDSKTRQARKRAEGLELQEALHMRQVGNIHLTHQGDHDRGEDYDIPIDSLPALA